ASDHDVVEVRDDEVSVVHVYVDAQGGQEQAGQSSDGKQADEAEGVEHRGLVSDGTLIDGGGPVKHFDRRGHGYEITQQREDERGVDRDAGHEHMVRPDEESDHRDAKQGQRHRLVAKNALTRKAANDFADDAHAGQNHDVDGRVGVEPEQMLEQERVSAQQRIKNAQVEQTLENYQHKRDRHDGRTQHLNDAGGVMGPDEKRQAVPG